MASFLQDPDNNPIVVAVGKEKNSTTAVKWAIDNLVLMPSQTLTLIHVRTKKGGMEANGGAEDIFKHFRAYCARKVVTPEEVILDGTDVHATLLDYINKHHVTSIVLGASSKGAFSRKFWTSDLPTSISTSAPDFCSMYIISKGKPQSTRLAARKAVNSRLPSPQRSIKSSQSDSVYRVAIYGDNKTNDLPRKSFDNKTNDLPRKSFDNKTNDLPRKSFDNKTNDLPRKSFERRAKYPTSYNSFSSDVMGLADISPAMDITRVEIPNHAHSQETPEPDRKSFSASEVLRLKQEVEQTIQMYNTACKEAISAQLKISELEQLKMSEAERIEQSRQAEEKALALVEMEKAKCRAAIEAAEKSQKKAEKETRRRRYAEQKAKREAEQKYRALNILSSNDRRCRNYSIEEIETATKKFSSDMKIGEGGYGPVYKGKLDHTPVAIKLLRTEAAQGRKQFQQEVDVLSCMRHPNMVLLLGACPEYGCLVYEFMDNGSLEDRLFRKGNTPPIPWGIRFKLAADIATGLLFLHQAKPEPLVHRDLKPGNILLDHHYTCKISDVGLARLVPPSVADSVTQYHMTSAAGTFCYIDPEYQQTGELGTKSDVYSLGVMLLQIITARPPMGLTHHVRREIAKGTFADLLDPTISDWPVEEALGYAKLALKCTELRKKDRPDLVKEVLPELNRLKEIGMKHGLRQ